MKKILIVVLLSLFGMMPSFASIIGDQINATLTEHISAHTQYTTKGENKLALLASVIQIGKWNGASIAQVRFGFTGITNPDKSTTPGAGYVGDIYMNAAPLIRQYVSLDPAWTFLNNVEVGPSFAYDFREHHSYLAVSVGLAFSLNPHP